MLPKINLEGLQSESRNLNNLHIDTVTTLELCRIINNEDHSVSTSITPCLPIIAKAIEALAMRAKTGGRVIYVGAGTSGRLGVLDASELPPTYSANPYQFVAIIAGGDKALRKAQEGAEDNEVLAVDDLRDLRLEGSQDAVIGIAASGRTPYVLSCLRYAKSIGCVTVAVSCCSPSAMGMSGDVDYMIEAVTGAEVVTGSTRMKAGSATKMILNMLSTGVMIKLGKTLGNMMVDVQATNFKLEQRARNIIREVCGAQTPQTDEELDRLLRDCEGSVKLAIASILLQKPVAEAAESLNRASGVLISTLSGSISTNVFKDENAATNSMTRQYVLCVDGGGSKCAAAIIDDQGNNGVGITRGCNLSDGNIETATTSIIQAVHKAMTKFSDLNGRTSQQVRFTEIWIGLAGFDRPQLVEQTRASLGAHFTTPKSGDMKVTNDVELVASIAGRRAKAESVIVLIAGTGSIAMTYQKSGGQYQRLGRRGGWGPWLGDDGSGFDMGRQAVRHALNTLETAREHSANIHFQRPHDKLTESVVNHFRQTGPEFSELDLLSEVVRPANVTEDISPRKRIADVARVVLNVSNVDKVAESIVERATRDVADLVKRAVSPGSTEPSSIVLALTGGLMSSEVFRQKVLKNIPRTEIEFKDVLHISNPALEGAEHLMNTFKHNVN